MTSQRELIIRAAVGDDFTAWQEYVDRTPTAGPLHHAGWHGVLREAFAVKPQFLIARDTRGEVRGILPSYVSRSPLTGGHVTSLEGGMLASDDGASTALLAAAKRLALGRGLRYLQLRGGVAGEPADSALRTVHTIIDTTQSAETLWAALKAKTRWGVRKSESQDVLIERDERFDGLDAFYGLYALHMRELGTPVFGKRMFRAMLSHLGAERLRLYLVRRGGQLLGGMLCVVHGAWWTDLYAIVRRTDEIEYANYQLYWHVIRDASESGVQAFDLGRSSPDSTVHRFKQKWVGRDEDVIYHFYASRERSRRDFGLLRETREKGLRQRVWSRLPPAICNIAGPIIRRDLPFL
jgi:hypothetical protein